MTAGEELTRALLHIADEGQRVPCQGRRHDRWTSDEADERAWAASICTSVACPVLEQCGAAADEMGEKWGVWGGVDRSPAPKTKRVLDRAKAPRPPAREMCVGDLKRSEFDTASTS